MSGIKRIMCKIFKHRIAWSCDKESGWKMKIICLRCGREWRRSYEQS